MRQGYKTLAHVFVVVRIVVGLLALNASLFIILIYFENNLRFGSVS